MSTKEIKDLTYTEKLQLKDHTIAKADNNLQHALEGAISDEYQSRKFRQDKETLTHVENAMNALAEKNIQEYLQHIEMLKSLKQDRKRRRKLLKHYDHKAEKYADSFAHNQDQQLTLQQQLYQQLKAALEQVGAVFKTLWQKRTELTDQINQVDNELDNIVETANSGNQISKIQVQHNFQVYQEGNVATQQIHVLGELNLSGIALLHAIKGLNKKKALGKQLDKNEAETQNIIDSGRAIYEQANEVGQQLGQPSLSIPSFLNIDLKPKQISGRKPEEDQPALSRSVKSTTLSQQHGWSQTKIEEIHARGNISAYTPAPGVSL